MDQLVMLSEKVPPVTQAGLTLNFAAVAGFGGSVQAPEASESSMLYLKNSRSAAPTFWSIRPSPCLTFCTVTGLKTKLFVAPAEVRGGSKLTKFLAIVFRRLAGMILPPNGTRCPLGSTLVGSKIAVPSPLKLPVTTICCCAAVAILFVTVVGEDHRSP